MVLDHHLDYYLHLSHYMLLQKFQNGNLHQINNFKVGKKIKKHIRNIVFVYIEHVKVQEASFNSN